jgi:type III secretion protein S
MQFETLSHEIYQSLIATLILVGPFLVTAIILGLVLGLVQAVTQIQDQTVPQLVKIVVLFIMFLAFASSLAIPLYEQAMHVFTDFPYLVH